MTSKTVCVFTLPAPASPRAGQTAPHPLSCRTVAIRIVMVFIITRVITALHNTALHSESFKVGGPSAPAVPNYGQPSETRLKTQDSGLRTWLVASLESSNS